jgi:prolyl-tRNA synthetase
MSAKKFQNAIAPTRQEDYPEWYQQVIKAADMAEMSSVRGCMVIKPWGYGIWEKIQRGMDDLIKETGHENAYFPLFIPLSFMELEAGHVEGFAKECAIVTHHRLVEKDGHLMPAGELEEPLIVRPTSETIIGRSFAKWIQSYRDLPLLINQWANIVRWEMRPRIFLRTTEFLWQEGHTAHSTEKEAMEETLMILDKVYRTFVEETLAIPVIVGEKTPAERFPGAVNTYCLEAMMQDRKALQAGTSHYLGQNFSRAFEVQFSNQAGEQELAYTTSWGVSSRLIGALVMVHSDDDGLRLPPKVAPKQVVIIPPIRLEIGARDMEANAVFMGRRDRSLKAAESVSRDQVADLVVSSLTEIQNNYFALAKMLLDEHTHSDIDSFAAFESFFTPENMEKPEIHGGFVRTKYCGNPECEEKAAALKVTIRCLPVDQSGSEGKCVICGAPATTDAIWAKAY